MNILIIPSWYSTEKNPTNGSFFREQALALKEKGHNVIVAFVEVTLEYNTSDDNKVKFIDDCGLKFYRVKQKKIRKTGNIGTIFSYKIGLKKILSEILKNESIDIIHLHSCLWAGIGAVSIKKYIKKPLVITEHSSFYSRYNMNLFYRQIVRYVARNCDSMICVSESMKRTMLKYKKDIIIIPNMVDGRMFQYSPVKIDGKFKFAVVCYLNKNKNIDVLIKAFNLAVNKIDVELIIGGSGPEEDKLKGLVNDLELSDRVTFIGGLSRQKVPKVMNECNVFVLPSRTETFGVVLVEALFTGRPIVTTRNGGAEDIVNSSNGLIVNPDNIEELSEALITMKENYKKYDFMKLSNDARDKYEKETVINRIEEIYYNMI